MGAERQTKLMGEILVGALFAALGIVVPILFHLVGLGRVFLPMDWLPFSPSHPE